MTNINNIIVTISWTQDDIKEPMSNGRQNVSDKDIDIFLSKFDLRYFEEQCICDGWERLRLAYGQTTAD